MIKKPQILVFIDWYLPGFKAGGPIRSVAAIIHALKDEADFSIVTEDRDFGDDVPFSTIKTNCWTTSPDGVSIFYCSPDLKTENGIKKILSEKKHDTIYFNSLFSGKFTINPLRLISKMNIQSKIILAPRGMLGKGALNIKPLRKKIFLNYSRVFGLYKNITWHASSEQEADEIRKSFGEQTSIVVAMNLSLLQSTERKTKIKNRGEVKFVFLSRISRKKNLLFALQLLKEIPSKDKVSYDIIGPIEDAAYWNVCLGAIAQLPEHVSVNILEAIPPDQIQKTLSEHHFFLFPTEHENFGHVILEALNAACPVIISDQTPWRNLEKEKCGWDVTLSDKYEWRKVIETAIRMDQKEYDVWSENAMKKAKVFQQDKTSPEPFRKLFLREGK